MNEISKFFFSAALMSLGIGCLFSFAMLDPYPFMFCFGIFVFFIFLSAITMVHYD